MFKGARYRVTCDELKAPLYTAEASYRLANAWWETKLAELTAPPADKSIMARYKAMDLQEQIAKGEAARRMLAALQGKAVDSVVVFPSTLPLQEHSVSDRLTYVAAADAVLEGKAVEKDKRLEKQAERFLSVERARGKAPGTYGDLAYYIKKLQDECPYLPKTLDVSTINEATVTDFYAWLRNESKQAPIVQRKLWGYFRRLVRFIALSRLCPIPINLDDRIFSFDVVAKKVKVYPIDEVRSMYAALPDRLKLYACLALNCGMLGVDMATLRHDELKNGRIRRKRTKTRNQKDVPEVEYVLWEETMALLNKYPRTHLEYVLTSKTGTPLWKAEIRDGEKKKYDLVGLQWHRGRGEGRSNKPPIPLKALRSVAATLIESEYGEAFATLFLGHSPRSIKDKHYAAPPQQRFDKCILWLRDQIFG